MRGILSPRSGQTVPRPAGRPEVWHQSMDNEVSRQDSMVVVLAETHAHVQWRTIAEEFSALLDSDFVDVLLKVRSKTGYAYLGAHRTLVAAAWKELREDLRRLERPPRELLSKSLSWLDMPGPEEPPSSSGHFPPESPKTKSPSSAQSAPGVTSSLATEAQAGTTTSGAAGSSSSSSSGPREAWPSRPRSPVDPLTEMPPNAPGVLDLSSRNWGCFGVVRALLCHLYSRPVAIPERELSILRSAAQSLGSTDLSRSCDDLDRRYVTRTAAHASEDGRRTSPDCPAPGFNATAHSGQRTTSAVERTTGRGEKADKSDRGERGERAGGPGGGGSDQSDLVAKDALQSLRPANAESQQEREVGPVRVASRPLKDDKSVDKSMLVKPRGERSLELYDKGGRRDSNREGGTAKPSAESGGVRRVLSEIKRNIVESSRIIADKTFHQMYEMIPGERGILGEGINGPVRMAKHRKNGQEVAVKKISCVNLSEQRRQMLVSEVRIFLQVSHRNIVQLLEVYESEADQAVLLVMELCTGKELFERLAERRWYSEFDAARVARQMLDAVSYLHSQNICHRDLKLENWIYENPTQEARLKLCDFGFGQIVEPSVQLTATLGSLFYLAPEVLEGSYGLPCDMWSIGVIVYMLLSGVPPFDGKTDEAVMQKIRQGRFVSTGKRWEAISETAKHFVRSLLRKDPYERLTAAEAAQHAWLKMDTQPKAYSWPKGSPDSELELPIDRGVIRDMWKFAQNNAITRAALGMLAKLNTSTFGGREEDVLTLESRFRSYDETNCGKIDAEAFIKVLKETMPLNQAEEKQFFERIAGNLPSEGGNDAQSGQKGRRRREVNYSDFITLTKARRMANNTAAIREAFRAFDESGDGFIREVDMHSILGDEFKSTIDDYVDINGKDLIDYVDFANIISKEMAKKEDQQESERQGSNLGGNLALGTAASTTGASSSGGEPSGDVKDAPSRNMSFIDMTDVPGRPVSEGEMQQDIPETTTIRGFHAAVAGTTAAAVAAAAGTEVQDSSVEQDMAKGAKLAASPRGAHGDAEGDEEEECDADAQSDEEQLVNVKKDESPLEAGDDAPLPKTDKEEKSAKQGFPRSSEGSRFQSFSLSLAGSSEYDDHLGGVMGVNRVVSMPSDVYQIRQQPGFHSKILRPFYAAKPVSNIVIGLIRGTSLYAKQSVKAKLATIIHTTWGWFFIMPNPKYHTEVDNRKGLLSKETGKFRFVAWWIHPRFVPQLRQWFERLTYEATDERSADARRQQQRESRNRGTSVLEGKQPVAEAEEGSPAAPGTRENGDRVVGDGHGRSGSGSQQAGDRSLAAGSGPESGGEAMDRSEAAPSKTAPDVRSEAPMGAPKNIQTEMDMGSPGDFRFSDVPKPEGYLHTYRDLHTKEHVSMLSQVYEGMHRFLRSLFDESFLCNAKISAGFHYPVRTQYATLHMQVRVNSGSVCRDDGRGIDIATLIDNMKRDRQQYVRDEDILRYHVTENVKVSLLAAASEYEENNSGESAARQTSPLSYELGLGAMPTIHDTEEAEEEDESGEGGKDGKSRAGWSPQVLPMGADMGIPCLDLEDQQPSSVCSVIPWPSDSLERPSDSMEDGDAVLSFLLNLQPTLGTAFHRLIYQKRDQCAAEFGDDPTYLYPLHISVTGFFETEARNVKKLVKIIRECLAKESCSSIRVGEVICTSTGYVLFDVDAPAISSMAQRLGDRSMKELDVRIRQKAVNHISLASNRPDKESRLRIKALYESPPSGEGDAMREAFASATFDLVLSRLLRRSSYEAICKDGPHIFQEVARIAISEDRTSRAVSPSPPASVEPRTPT